jgi:hypothetical protein
MEQPGNIAVAGSGILLASIDNYMRHIHAIPTLKNISRNLQTILDSTDITSLFGAYLLL